LFEIAASFRSSSSSFSSSSSIFCSVFEDEHENEDEDDIDGVHRKDQPDIFPEHSLPPSV
jgi:hypothetical protein